MGLFDSLLNAGKNAVTKAAAEKISEAVNDKLGGVMDGLSSVTQGLDAGTFGKEAAAYTKRENSNGTSAQEAARSAVSDNGKAAQYSKDKRPFDVKFREAIDRIGGCEIAVDISPDELEQEYGQTIYTRGGCYCLPDKIAYKLTKDGGNVMYIRLWHSYSDYCHAANNQIMNFCIKNGIKMLDFFEYMPNTVDYMANRISEQFR